MLTFKRYFELAFFHSPRIFKQQAVLYSTDNSPTPAPTSFEWSTFCMQVDESVVEVLHIVSSPDGFGLNAVDSYRYPRAGRINTLLWGLGG